MNPHDPEVLARQQEMRRLLVEEGLSVSEVEARVGLSKKRIYHFLRREGLPSNPPIKAGSPKEQKLLAMVGARYPKKVICRVFKIAPCVLARIIERARDAKTLDDPG